MSRARMLLAVAAVAVGVWGTPLPAEADVQEREGVLLPVQDGFLRLAPCAPGIVRVAYARYPEYFQRRSLAVEGRRCDSVAFELTRGPGEAILTTSALRIRIDTATGLLRFEDASGKPILTEAGRSLSPALVQGEQTYHVQQRWADQEGESLYGLGQQQLGLVDVKGYDLDLWQHNATVVIPFLVSSRGYGIFWDNTSFTRFGDLREAEPIPADHLFDLNGRPGGLTGRYYAGAGFERLVATRIDPAIDIAISSKETKPNPLIHPDLPDGDASVRWEGEVLSEQAGDYTFKAFSNNGIRLWLDGRLVMDHWRQGWLPWHDVARVRFEANTRHRVKLEWYKEQGMETLQLLWKTPSPSRATSLWSEVGDGVDYTFVYGPSLDDVVAGYRRLTGRASLMPRWAFGLWQSRQRYETAQQSLDAIDGFRSRRIPFDNIVQDWFYWREKEWGSHEFDPARFPDPDGWLKAIHDRHARLMISVWGKFYPGTRNFDAMQSRGFLFQPNLAEGLTDWVGPGYRYTFYDAFNAEAGRLFWDQVNGALFAKGVDAWWMDATEPDLSPTPTLETQRTRVNPTALGSGSRMLNAYALYNSRAIYEGQRRQAPDQRVFILTRSGFAGQQRYAAATWSGDVSSTWTRAAAADCRGTRLLDLGHALLDHGHRRLLGARPLLAKRRRSGRRRGVARAQHALVPVRQLRPHDARPRRGPEAGDVGAGRRVAPRLPGPARVRPPALPAPALRVLAGRIGHPRGRDLHAAAGHGFPGRHRGSGDHGSVLVRPRASRQPGDDLQGSCPFRLSPCRHRLVRLLDRQAASWRADAERRGTL